MLRLAVFAVLVPLAGCPAPQVAPPEETPGSEFPVFDEEPAEVSPDLEAARARWQAASLDRYRMTLQRICFCPSPDYTGPFEVTVADGEVQAVTLNGAAVDAERGESVEALFALIDDAYERGAVDVALEFDPDLGYPTSIGIDYSFQMADEEIGYRVSNVRRVAR